jgi:hypothetical protein
MYSLVRSTAKQNSFLLVRRLTWTGLLEAGEIFGNGLASRFSSAARRLTASA